MQAKLLYPLTVAAVLAASGGAQAIEPFEGNTTGGIISWSPEAQRHRHAIASDHCARYGKVHRITSVHPWPGDYIGFACYLPRGVATTLEFGRPGSEWGPPLYDRGQYGINNDN